MTEAQAVAGHDRLPWLTDDAPARKRSGLVLPLAVVASIGVAVASYWIGVATSDGTQAPLGTATMQPTTVPLSDARPVEPRVLPTPQRAEPVEPLAAEPIAIEQPTVEPVRHVAVERLVIKPVAPVTEPSASDAKADAVEDNADADDTADSHGPPQLWPVRAIEGASGRLVRVGTFTSAHQAKKGWWAIMKVNPALNHLPALVVPVRSLRDNQVYYRLQMGTTSQAHSTVLCQRMRMIAQSCVVIGLNGEGNEVAM